MDFNKAIESAQQLPEPSESQNPIPDLLQGKSIESFVRTVGREDVEKIPGATEYDLEFQCARLMIGQKQTGFAQGVASYEEIDDADRLKEIMDKSLSGKAVIHKKIETFLKDGSVVIWVEWMEVDPNKRKPKKDRSYLSSDELLTPVHSSELENDNDDFSNNDDE